MARIVYYVAASLDGFIADATGGVDWLPAGEPDDYGYAEFYGGVEAMVMGRRTYDQALSFGEWPYLGKPAYVFTHSPPSSGLSDIRFVQSNPADFVNDVADGYSGTVWLVGGANLADQFLRAGLIDEFWVFVIPTILGEGVPLFGGADSPTVLELESVQSHADGVVRLRYYPSKKR